MFVAILCHTKIQLLFELTFGLFLDFPSRRGVFIRDVFR
jgi:hypothetical protein